MSQVSAVDVAAYILQECGEMPKMKLQKLVYYCQAWSLVWDEAPLFHEPIEAWANGPVVRELFNLHRNQFTVSSLSGDASRLSPIQKETVDSVLDFYNPHNSQWLSDLTHMEDPWKDARQGLSPGERGNRQITHAAMMQYYRSL